MMKKIKLGEKYRDRISGFEGVATGRFEYLNGCVRYCLEGPHKDGERRELVVDEQDMETLKAEKPAPTAKRGGPRNDAITRR